MQTKRKTTTMEAAFEKAGVDTDLVALNALADECLRKGTRQEAILAFGLKCISERNYLNALVRDFLDRRKTNGLRGEDQLVGDDQHIFVQTTQLTPLPGEGQIPLDAHSTTAQPRQQGEGGQVLFETHFAPASPPELSAETRKAYAKAANVISITIMDTHRLSNGVVIGEVYWGSLNRLRSASARDTALLRQLINYGQADAHKKVRDIVPVEQMQLMIQKAAEIADAM